MASISERHLKAVNKNMQKGQKKALATFHQAARRVPAYKDFLDKQAVNPKKIKNFGDFQHVPPVTKDNYLRQYPLDELMWDGSKFNADLISVSSGSTGEPFFWLRDRLQHEEAADIYYDIYKNAFNSDSIPTLLVVCFSMGIWIAGSYTTLGAVACAERGLKMNVITPALDVHDSVAVIKRLKDDYEQIILAGYPPFLKDLVDKGMEDGIGWKNLNVGFTAAGETITEELREYFLKHGTANSDPKRVISIYGTVDAGIVAYETPFTIPIRRGIYQSGRQEQLFGRGVMPTLGQFNPLQKYIEEIDGNIVFTSGTGLPLVRYNIKDTGGVITDVSKLNDEPGGVMKILEKENIKPLEWARPLVYVHGRADFTASLYAVLIYPENIKKAMFDPELTKFTTGRFVMSVKNKKNLDQYLEIIIETKAGIKPAQSHADKVRDAIISTLLAENTEYRKLRSSIGEKTTPKIILKPQHDPQYFSRTPNKQSWTRTAAA
ncbi:MAG TPA: hypothetical protein VFW52_01155 [Candidatus Saccharimonadales bacterium]|nr:hypothetical protein [Candidatus Saccharimonadales bacterium]